MTATDPNSASQSYKSPKRKLIKFFEKSRNKWKEKCREAKYQVKLLRNRMRYLEKSKNNAKKRVQELEVELRQMKDNEQRLVDELERLKKNRSR